MTKPLRIVVLGGGGIGSVVAAHLARTEHDVTLVTRGEHLSAIGTNHLEVRGLANFTSELDAAETASGDCDVLIVATKTPDTVSALESVSSLRPASVTSLQNGLLKEKFLITSFGVERVLGATTMIGATRILPGVVEYTLDGVTALGELDGQMTQRVEALAESWNESGLKMMAVTDVLAHEWAKQAIQAAAAPLAVLTNLPSYLLWGTRPLAEEIVLMIREVADVARHLGIELSDYKGYGFDVRAVATESPESAVERVLSCGAALLAAGKTEVVISMLQDVRARRRTEIEETVGFVVSEADRLGVKTPLLDFVYQVVCGIEQALGVRA
jgi:2-dehydropantoate 2-reductase